MPKLTEILNSCEERPNVDLSVTLTPSSYLPVLMNMFQLHLGSSSSDFLEHNGRVLKDV